MKLLIPLMISIQATTTEPEEACPGKFSNIVGDVMKQLRKWSNGIDVTVSFFPIGIDVTVSLSRSVLM